MASNGLNGLAINGTNGVHRSKRLLRKGIYAPIPTFFQPETEDLDLDAFSKHVLRVAEAGVTPLLSGSMGEALHLSHTERSTLITTARHVLDSAGLDNVPIVAGTGSGSTRETILLCKEAAAAGADAAIVIASGVYAGVLAKDRSALKAFWSDVSEKSPIPVIIYNYPGATGGIDLDSELIVELAKDCPNLAGVKLTCGNVGKLTRICATVSQPSFVVDHPRKDEDFPFLVLGGYADFIVPGLYANAHGSIAGLGNIAPHSLARLFDLATKSLQDRSCLPETQHLQGIIARADATIASAGIAGTKLLLEKLYGYGGCPRRPLLPCGNEVGERLWMHPDTQALVSVERELSGKAKVLGS